MNRKGHIGMTLLAFAPVAHMLVRDGKFLLAVLCWLGVQAVEPLPDQDFHLPGLSHRGISHSLLAVLVVGCVLGATGWLLGDRLFDVLYAIFSTGGDLWGQLLDRLPDLLVAILTAPVPNIPPGEIVSIIKQQAGGTVDRRGFATFGFGVGAGGVLAHLLGDVITMRGINPFLPLSRWRLSLSSLRADSPVANAGLFGLGMVAIAVVLVATMPGAVLGAGIPTNLSPVGVAAGQDAIGPQNGSVTINKTASNRTQIVLESVTLPQNGYIVAQTGNVSANQSGAKTIVVGHTQYVRSGIFSDVVLTLNTSVRGPTTVSITLHNDTNNNRTWDGAKTDAPYRTANGTVVYDTVRFGSSGQQTTVQRQNTTSTNTTVAVSRGTPNATPTPTASIQFADQRSTEASVTVRSVTLPDGGWVVVHNESYLRGGNPLRSIIGSSQYLPPGTHRNVTFTVIQGVSESQTLVAVANRDTNGDKLYDYPFSNGTVDGPYTAGGEVVADRAYVTVINRTTTTAASVTTTAAQPAASPSTATADSAPSETTQPSTRNSTETGSGGVGAWISSNTLLVGGVVVVILALVVLPTFLRRS